MISKQECEALLMTPEAAQALQNIGVDVVGLVDLMDYIFQEENDLSFLKFMETVLQLRGSNTATVKDIVDLRKFMAQALWKGRPWGRAPGLRRRGPLPGGAPGP